MPIHFYPGMGLPPLPLLPLLDLTQFDREMKQFDRAMDDVFRHFDRNFDRQITVFDQAMTDMIRRLETDKRQFCARDPKILRFVVHYAPVQPPKTPESTVLEKTAAFANRAISGFAGTAPLVFLFGITRNPMDTLLWSAGLGIAAATVTDTASEAYSRGFEFAMVATAASVVAGVNQVMAPKLTEPGFIGQLLRAAAPNETIN